MMSLWHKPRELRHPERSEGSPNAGTVLILGDLSPRSR
jgi:hypothetical protein